MNSNLDKFTVTVELKSGMQTSPVPTHLLDIKDSGKKVDHIESAENSGLT